MQIKIIKSLCNSFNGHGVKNKGSDEQYALKEGENKVIHKNYFEVIMKVIINNNHNFSDI